MIPEPMAGVAMSEEKVVDLLARPAHWCAMIRHGYVRILNVRPELLAELGMLPGGVGWRLYAGYWN